MTPTFSGKIIGLLHGFWSRFVRENGLLHSDRLETDDRELKIQQHMHLFIHQHYMDKITLDDIALHCGFVHNSYYAQIFRRTYGCSPKTYRERHIR